MGLSRNRGIALIILTLVALHAFQASAKDLLRKGHGMDLRVFRPAVDTKGHFTMDGTPILPHLKISLGMVLDFGFNHWIAVEQEEDIYKKTVLKRSINSVFIFNLGLWNRAVVGIQIPLGITAGNAYNGLNDEGDPTGDKWSTRGAFGDLALHAKASLLRSDRNTFGLGAVIQYQMGSGKPELLMGEPSDAGAFSAKLIFDVETTYWYRFGLNVGIRLPFNPRKENLLDDDFNNGNQDLLFRYGPILTAGLGQSFTIAPGVIDFVLEVYANQLASELGNGSYMSLEANGGFKIYVDKTSYLMAGAAAGLPVSGTDSGYGFQSAQWRLFFGIAFEPSMGDRDHDGIPDDEDQCPGDLEDYDGFEDSDGCPDPDNDGDGILDVDDDCPLVQEDFDGIEDEDGCPESEIKDQDKDGIPDEIDQCPKEREDIDGFEDKDGCPDKDNDMDGIPDTSDTCPNEKEIINGFRDEDGCPDEGEELVTVTEDNIVILKGIRFKTGSHEIVGDNSFMILDAVVTVLQANPDMKVRIEGHTDSVGGRAYNLGLSRNRAKSVKSYLVEQGISGLRLKSRGYGLEQPIETNDTEEGRSANRRVMFAIISR